MALGGTVVVVEPPARPLAKPLAEPGRHRAGHLKGLAGGDDVLERAAVLPRRDRRRGRGGIGELAERDEGEKEALHPLRLDQGEERLGIAAGLLGGEDEGAAGEPGGADLLERDVEAERGELQGAGGPGKGSARLPVEEAGERRPRHPHPLGAARRAGGVEDVGEVLSPSDRERTGGGTLARAVLRDEDPPAGERRNGFRQALLGDEHGGLGIVEHEAQALGRIAGVEGHIGGAGLEHREDRDHQLRRAFQAEPDPHPRTGPQPAEAPGEAFGASRELAVGEGPPFPDDREGIGNERRPGREPRLQGSVPEAGRGVVPLPEQRLALGGREDRQLGEAPAGVRGDGGEQDLQLAEDPPGGRPVEEVGPVGEPGRQPLLGVEDGQVEVEHGDVVLLRDRREREDGETGDDEGRSGDLDGAHHLEERAVREAALGLELLDELAERQLLVGEGADRHLLHPREEGREGGIAA